MVMSTKTLHVSLYRRALALWPRFVDLPHVANELTIRPYRESDERGWLVCRVLSFLDTAFFDDVRQVREQYEHPAIELVAERAGQIVGLIDVECEEAPGTVCEDRPGLGGMSWHLRGACRLRQA